jgi:tight adherence protein C
MEITMTMALVMVFASVALISASITYVALETASPTRRRLRNLLAGPSRFRTPAAEGLSEEPSPVLQRIKTFIPKSPKEMSRLQQRLARAGFHKPKHVAIYLIAEIAIPIVAFAVTSLVMGLRSGLVFAILAAIVGYLIPSLILERFIKQRQKEIQNGLPDALDLLIVSIEAGLAIDQAMMKCAEELYIAYPALAEELRFINVECRAGKPRLEAFKNFATRTKVDDVRALVAMLVQTDRFGTSVGQALRTHAEVSRTKRRQRAEERAAKIGVKLVFPLVFFLFPAFYIVTLGPAVIKFVHAFSAGGSIGGGIK